MRFVLNYLQRNFKKSFELIVVIWDYGVTKFGDFHVCSFLALIMGWNLASEREAENGSYSLNSYIVGM